MIALDVARGVEYLHCFGHQSFIHRDLKPCNILLGDDMRARLQTLDLLMGEVSTKIDVYSFGVILMELITGRRTRGITLEEESVPLVKWFLQTYKDEVTFRKAVDPTLDLDEETLACVSTVAELAAHCCASKPHKRPNMSQVVNVLSYLVDPWNVSKPHKRPT
ncbi:putative protein kinase RLK-Pelle-LRR-IX family [Helianthus anomalus]